MNHNIFKKVRWRTAGGGTVSYYPHNRLSPTKTAVLLKYRREGIHLNIWLIDRKPNQ